MYNEAGGLVNITVIFIGEIFHMPNSIAAKRALDVINNLGGEAEAFRRKWLTIHAFSTEFERNNQRHTLLETVRASITEKDALAILEAFQSDINYLSQHPVGNLALDDAHPNFYRNARRDIGEVSNTDASAIHRLGHLLCVVYQVRCNTEHGRKKLGTARSQKLFSICNRILDAVITVLLKEAGAA